MGSLKKEKFISTFEKIQLDKQNQSYKVKKIKEEKYQEKSGYQGGMFQKIKGGDDQMAGIQFSEFKNLKDINDL